jgi:hypothetical protein
VYKGYTTLRAEAALNVKDQVSHPYIPKYRIIAFYILIFTLLDRKLVHKRFWTEWYWTFPGKV